MRKLFTVLAGAIWVIGFAPVAMPQQTPGYQYWERHLRPVGNALQYPKWLNPVVVDADMPVMMPPPPRYYTQPGPPTGPFEIPDPPYPTNVLSRNSDTLGSNNSLSSPNTAPSMGCLAVAVNSRNVVHIAGTVYLPGQANTQITYYNSKYNTRRANGFSEPYIIDQNGVFSDPDIAVNPEDDTVHVVYVYTDANGFTSIRYSSMLPAGMWGATMTVVQGSANGNYREPKIRVGPGGTVHIIYVANTNNGNNYFDSYVAYQQGLGGSSTVSGSLYFTDTNNPAGSRPGEVSQIQLALSGNTPSVAWRVILPDQIAYVNGPNEARGRLEVSVRLGQAVQITNNAGGRYAFYQRRPEVAAGPNGNVHVTWNQNNVPATPPGDPRNLPEEPPGVYYRNMDGNGAAGATQTVYYGEPAGGAMNGGVRMVVDSRNQPKLIFSIGATRTFRPWTGRIPVLAALINGSNGWMWEEQYPVAFGNITNWAPMGGGGPQTARIDMGDRLDITIGGDDQIHLVDSSQYTRTLEKESGVRDPHAMVGVFPGASVNVTNGNLHYELPLFSTKGAGLNQGVSLIYNSIEGYSGLLSQGWKLNYEVTLIDHYRSVNNPGSTQPDWIYPETATVIMPDGRWLDFRWASFANGVNGRCYMVAGNNFDPTGSIMAKLERMNVGALMSEYRLTFKDGTVYTFNTDGKLRMIEDAGGNSISIGFSGGRPSTITDKLNRTTEIQYESTTPLRSPRITRITDPAGNDYDIQYQLGPGSGFQDTTRHISSVQFSGGAPPPTWSFEYCSMNQMLEPLNLMKRALPPRGAGDYGWQIRYTNDRRALAVVDPPDDQRALNPNPADMSSALTPEVVFLYNDQISATNVMYESVVRDRRGHQTRFVSHTKRSLVFEVWDHLVLPPSWSPSSVFSDPTPTQGLSPLRYAYDYQSLLLSSTNRWDVETSYQYSTSLAFGFDHVIDLATTIQRGGTGTGGALETIASLGYTDDGLHQLASQSSAQVTTGLYTGVNPVRLTTYLYYQTNSGVGNKGQLQSVTYPNNTTPTGVLNSPSSTGFVYAGPWGALTQSTDEEGRTTTYSDFHPVHGLPGRKTSPGCTQYEQFTYDVMGNVLSHTLPQGGSGNAAPGATQYEYNDLYQLVEVTLPPGSAPGDCTTIYGYDLDGNLNLETPPVGAVRSTQYNRLGQATAGSGPDGNWTQTVDANGNVRTHTDPRSVVTTRIYDALNRLVELRQPGGSTAGGGGGGVEMVTVNVYDQYWPGDQHATQVIRGGSGLSASNPVAPGAQIVQTIHDPFGRPVQISGPDPFVLQVLSYNQVDQVWASQEFGPDVVNGILMSAFQRVVYSFYDERGRVMATRTSGNNPNISQEAGQNSETSLTWLDRTGRVIRTQDGGGIPTNFDLDGAGRVQYVRDAMNVIVEERIYGDDGLLVETKVPDPMTKTATRVTARKMSYTSRKELWKDLNAADKGLTYEYKVLPGQVDTVTDAIGVVTRTTYYDMSQRPDVVTEAYGSGTGRQTKHTWTAGLLTETRVYNPATGQFNASYVREYDQAGRLEQVREPQRNDHNLTYNEFGLTVADNQGILSSTHVHNLSGLPTDSIFVRNGPGGGVSTSVERMYNGSGLMTSISDATLTVQTGYSDPTFAAIGNAAWRGLPRQENFQTGAMVWTSQSHGYDAGGRPSTLTDSESMSPNHSWVRDENGRVIELRFNGALVTSYDYTPGGLLDFKRIYGASSGEIARQVYYYDSLGRKIAERTSTTGGNVRSHVVWEFDDADRIEAKDLRHLGVRSTYQYNDFGEMTADQSPGNSGWGGGGNPASGIHGFNFSNVIGGPATGNESDPCEQVESQVASSVMSVPGWNRQYEYDLGGNRISETIDGVSATYTYGSGSRLQQVVRGNVTVNYSYDGLGNLTSKLTEEEGEQPITETYEYDYMNRLSVYTNSDTGASWSYQHWPNGDRYEKRDETAGTATLFVSRGGDVVTEYEDTGSSVNFVNRFVQGTGIDSKAIRIAQDGLRRHYVGDQVGTLLMTLADNGAVSEQCVRDSYGNSIAGDTNDERYRFAQREHDTESGLVYMRHRMYDPQIGRFTQVEPLTWNRPFAHYSYAGNNPVSANDPTGLITQKDARAWRIQAENFRKTDLRRCNLILAWVDIEESIDRARLNSSPTTRLEEKRKLINDMLSEHIAKNTIDCSTQGLRQTPPIGATRILPDNYAQNREGMFNAVAEARNDLILTAVGGIAGKGLRLLRRGDAVLRHADDVARHSDDVANRLDDLSDEVARIRAESRARHGITEATEQMQAMRRLPDNALRASGPDEVYRRLKQHHGISPELASERLHKIKQEAGVGPADDLLFDLTGNVYDPKSKAWLGSLTEGGAK